MILLVDNSEDLLGVLARVCEVLSVSYDTALDGSEAIEKAKRTKYTLILMDLSMPGIDGLVAARAIRAPDGLNSDARMIAFTGDNRISRAREARAAGFDDVLVKPASLADFRRLFVTDKTGT